MVEAPPFLYQSYSNLLVPVQVVYKKLVRPHVWDEISLKLVFFFEVSYNFTIFTFDFYSLKTRLSANYAGGFENTVI